MAAKQCTWNLVTNSNKLQFVHGSEVHVIQCHNVYSSFSVFTHIEDSIIVVRSYAQNINLYFKIA